MIIKAPVLFFSFMAGGAGLLGLALGVFSPRPGPHQAVVVDAPSRPVEPPAEVVIGDLELTASAPTPPPAPAKRKLARRVTAAQAAPEPTATPESTGRPCGEWTEIGAVYQSGEGATGVHRVRPLCP